jgi:cold shock CspA family protein
MPKGTITTFDSDRGFGFIQFRCGTSIFFHVSATTRKADEIAIGAAVTFKIGIDERLGKRKAILVDFVE